MRLKGETVSSLFSLPRLPSPCCACHTGYLLVALPAQPRSQSFSLISDVTSSFKLVVFGSKPPLVTRIARTGLGTRLLPANMKDDYVIHGSGLENVAKIEYF